MPAFLNQFADGLRCGSHARFAGPDFGWNADAHMDESVSVAKILERSLPEGIARLNLTRIETTPEPSHALFRRTMGK
jgi:hypothetical protein